MWDLSMFLPRDFEVGKEYSLFRKDKDVDKTEDARHICTDILK